MVLLIKKMFFFVFLLKDFAPLKARAYYPRERARDIIVLFGFVAIFMKISTVSLKPISLVYIS